MVLLYLFHAQGTGVSGIFEEKKIGLPLLDEREVEAERQQSAYEAP